VTATMPARQRRPIVASDGVDFLSVWLESSGSRQQAVAKRFNRSGEPRDGSGVPLANVGTVYETAITDGPGSQMLIVQSSESGLWAERWSGIAGPLDDGPILISSKTNAYPAVVWNGTRYFVVWSEGTQLSGTFVGDDGAVSQTVSLPFASATHDGIPYSTSIAWDGRDFLVTVYASDTSVCTTLCVGPLPGELRLFRVSAEGNVLDVPAIEIPGKHWDAHVASSGSEFLIAFDNAGSVSSMVVHSTTAGVQLGEETTIFSWPDYVPSGIAWDGSAYVVTWHYAAGNDAWLATARIDRSGKVLSTSVATTFPPEPIFGNLTPSIAVNDAGDTAIVVEEATPPSSLSRARAYFTSEFAPMPPPPAAPGNAVSYLGGSTALIEWQSDGGAMDFVLEKLADGYSWLRLGTVTGEVRSATVQASVGNLVRVSALGPGGMSSGTITSIGSSQRRRAERP
ncbi:MAG: hypothetical protein ACRD3J_00805, partial [Thermoanaerobaculia bacterium]